MTDSQANVAKLLSEKPQWRWESGMLALRWAPGCTDHLKPELRVVDEGGAAVAKEWGSVPDLSDPSTEGWLITMLPRGTTAESYSDGSWAVGIPPEWLRRSGLSLGEACARNLIKLWEKS